MGRREGGASEKKYPEARGGEGAGAGGADVVEDPLEERSRPQRWCLGGNVLLPCLESGPYTLIVTSLGFCKEAKQ